MLWYTVHSVVYTCDLILARIWLLGLCSFINRVLHIYSASAVDKATEFCFLLNQETRERPSKWQPPEVLLRSTRLPAKSEFEYPKRSKLAPLGYHKPMLGVCLRYRRILFTAERCDSFGLAWKRAHTKHYIGPRCGKVKQRPYHRTIKRLINRFTVHIQVEMPIGCHGCLDWLALIHLEILQDIFSILFLMDECPFLQLFDLKTKEEGQLTDHGHLEFLRHQGSKLMA